MCLGGFSFVFVLFSFWRVAAARRCAWRGKEVESARVACRQLRRCRRVWTLYGIRKCFPYVLQNVRVLGMCCVRFLCGSVGSVGIAVVDAW